jgi:hypothetical protein
MKSQRWKWIGITVGGWLLVATFIAMITVVTEWEATGKIIIMGSLIFEWLCIIPWILVTPFIYFVAQKYPLYERFSWHGLGWQVMAFLAAITLHNIGQSLVVFLYYDFPASWEYLWRDWIGFLDMRLMLYGALLAIIWTITAFRKEQQAKLQEAMLNTELEQAKTTSAHDLMQPRLIVRSLDSIRSALQKSQVDRAERQLTRLSDVLRSLLRRYKERERYGSDTVHDEHTSLLHYYIQLLEAQYDCQVIVGEALPQIFGSDQKRSDAMLTQVFQLTEELIREVEQGNLEQVTRITYRLDNGNQPEVTISVEGSRAFRRVIPIAQAEEAA